MYIYIQFTIFGTYPLSTVWGLRPLCLIMQRLVFHPHFRTRPETSSVYIMQINREINQSINQSISITVHIIYIIQCEAPKI